MFDVKVPAVGESITEGILVEWAVANGAFVKTDDPLFDLETDKVTLAVSAEGAGKLEILVEAGSTVKIGQKVASIDPNAGEAPVAPAPKAEKKEETGTAPAPSEREPGLPKETPAGMEQARAKLQTHAALSPAVRRLVDEHGLEPGAILGTGKGGRLIKGDVLNHIERNRAAAGATSATGAAGEAKAEPPAAQSAPEVNAAPPAAQSAPANPGECQTRVPMSRLRQRVAERLIQAQQTAAILTTFNEIDMSNVIAWRESLRQDFQDRHGIKLGFMSFFVKAVVDALKTVPELGAQIQGDEIVYNHYHDLGVAVGTEKGLVVPVIRDADAMSFGGIEHAIAEMAQKARDRTLTLADLSGGVFTISNGGIYGNMLSTPILNPPQSGILGMHAIKKRPVVVEEEIVIRPMMYVALSYDHRIVDGKEAVTFLGRIVDCIEHPERMMLEI